GHEPVVRPERGGGRDLDPLVSAARANKWRAALLDQDVHAVVERLGHAHPAMQLELLLLGRGVFRGCRRHQPLVFESVEMARAMSTTSAAVRPRWPRCS